MRFLGFLFSSSQISCLNRYYDGGNNEHSLMIPRKIICYYLGPRYILHIIVRKYSISHQAGLKLGVNALLVIIFS